MKAWLIRFSIASAVLLAISCGDDDSSSDDAGAGEGGEHDHTHAGAGGTDSSSGGASAGADGVEAGAGGAPAAPMCEPPTPAGAGEGGAGGAGEPTSSALAIVGSYTDGFADHVVTASGWTRGSDVYHISAFDNEQSWVVARNDQENPYFPCLWSRFDWTEFDSKLYYCQTAFDAPSEAAALDAEAPDPSDPANDGCGESNFAWSELTEK